MKKMKLIQQGDVILELVETLPKEAKRQKPRERGVVLADGETTGHAHVMAPMYTSLFLVGTLFYVKVEKQTTLTHEEHNHLEIPPGVYKVRQVREYDHFAEEARRVRD